MKPPFHYELRTRRIQADANSEPIYIKKDEVFEDAEPIVARERAIEAFQNYIDVLPPDFIPEALFEKVPIGHSALHAYIGIYLVEVDSPANVTEAHSEPYYAVYAKGFAFQFPPDGMMDCLKDEYELYERHHLDMRDYHRRVSFFGVTSKTQDGPEVHTYDILRTPFNWEGYNKPHSGHWDGWDDDASGSPADYLSQLAKGETNVREFKSRLLGPGPKGQHNKQIAAKVISAFLNSNGGRLFIGVNDDGKPVGLDDDYKIVRREPSGDRDSLMNEFDRILESFFQPHVWDKIDPDICSLNGFDVLIVTVKPATEPIFLETRSDNGTTKEFWIRRRSGCYPIKDIQEIVSYCLNRWRVSDI